MDVLDSVTLQRLQCLRFPWDRGVPRALIFSPDSRLLTITHIGESLVVSWDLLTGVAGAIPHSIPSHDITTSEFITYSTNGTMIAILRENSLGQGILSIYDAVHHKHMHDTYLPSEDTPCGLWTRGETLWLAAFNPATAPRTGPKSITVWEVGFTAGATMTAVETLSVPESVMFSRSSDLRFPQSTIYPSSPSAPLPVVLTSRKDALVWDARNSKFLLHFRDTGRFHNMTFSSDGRFVAGENPASGVYIWKYSPTGYALHGKLASGRSHGSGPHFSPNGESIITFDGPTISLWHMKNLTAPRSHNFADPVGNGEFLLEILPSRSLAAIMRYRDGVVTLFDIRSGAPQLTIDAGMRGLGLGLAEDAVVVIGEGKATTWKLPGTFLPGAIMNTTDSTRTVVLPGPGRSGYAVRALMSPDLRYIIVGGVRHKYIHDATTGESFGDFSSRNGLIWSVPDIHQIGDFLFDNVADIWKITTEGTVELSAVGVDIGEGRWGYPYTPSRGYRIAGDGWVFDRNGRRLLFLPPLWRSRTRFDLKYRWRGQFLGLLTNVPRPVIIDLEP